MSGQTEWEALAEVVPTIASALAMSYGSHVSAPKGGRDWKAAEDLLGVLDHLGYRLVREDDEALVERVADAIDAHRYSLIDIGKCVCGVKTDNMPDHQARAILDAIEGVRS